MPHTKDLVESRISSRNVYSGALLHVYRDEVRLPDGQESVREFIRHPGASAIVPIHANGDVVLLRQYRYPAAQVFIEVPAGKLDPGEHPDVTAARELTEETGLEAGRLVKIGHFHPGIGYSDEVIHIYAATDLREGPGRTDADEFLEPFRVPFEEAVGMVHRGEITDGKTVICLLRAWEWWSRRSD